MKPLFKLPHVLMPDRPELEMHLRKTKEAIEDGGRRLEAIPFLDGIWIQDISLPAVSSTVVNHKLGRIPRGWIMTRVQGGARIPTETARDSTTITIYNAASFAMTVDFWFF
jgi:hypothetical protein